MLTFFKEKSTVLRLLITIKWWSFDHHFQPSLIMSFILVGAFVTWRILCAPRARGAPRKRRRIILARITRRRPWTARMSSVIVARCAPLIVREAILTTRTYACATRSLYRSALPSEFRLACSQRSLHGTLPVVVSASVRLCLCSFLLYSSLLSSVLCSARLCLDPASRSSRRTTAFLLVPAF